MATPSIEMTTQYSSNATSSCSTIKESLISNAGYTYWLVAVLSLYFLVGVFGNGILVVLMAKEKSLRDVNNALITNLAVSDFMYVGLFVPIFIFSEFYGFRPFGITFCVISIMANYTSQDVSTLSLTALSYFRYCAIVTPFRSRRKKRSKLIFAFCALSWLIGAAASIYPTLFCEEHPRRECFFWSRHRVQVFDENEKFFRFFWIRFVFLYLLPLVTIVYFYGRVAYTLCVIPTSLEGSVPVSVKSHNRTISRSRKRLRFIVLIIVVIFFVSWLPTYIYWLTGLDDTFFIEWLNLVRKVTMFIPATTNPIILIVTSTSYRKSFFALFSKSVEKPQLTLRVPLQ